MNLDPDNMLKEIGRFSKDITDEEIKEQLFIAYKQRCEKQRERYNNSVEEVDCECGKKVIGTYLEKHKLTTLHKKRVDKLKILFPNKVFSEST